MSKIRIQILMQRQQNRRLLVQFLETDYHIILDSETAISDEVQLIIVDTIGLNENHKRILEHKTSIAPLYLPILLIDNNLHKFTTIPEVWDVVDNMLETPVQKVILQSQIKVLLRTRNLSQKIFEQAQSLQHLQRAVDSTSDCVFLLGVAGVNYLNPAAQQLFGFELADFVDDEYLACIDNEDQQLKSAIEKARTHKWQGEIMLRRNDGQQVPVFVRIDQIVQSAIEPSMVIMCTDMTEQKRMQDAERKQRVLAEVLQDTAITLTSTLDMREVFERILENIERVIPQQATAISLVENGYGAVVLSRGYSDEVIQERNQFLADTPLHSLRYFQEIIETKQPVYLKQLSEMSLPHLDESTAIIIQPIVLNDDLMGFITVEHQFSDRNFQEYIERLSAFAAQAAIAIQNARLYARAQSAAVMEERHRIARDFHDSVSQTLFSASVIAESIQRRWTDIPNDVTSLLNELHTLTRGALAETRTMLLELKPTKLLETDLKDLLKQLAEAIWSHKQIDLTIDLQESEGLPLRLKVAMYRVAREALHNIIKHSDATVVTVYYRGSSTQAILRIADNGVGFVLSEAYNRGMGLTSMSERAEKIDGKLIIDTMVGKGTTIEVRWDMTESTEHE